MRVLEVGAAKCWGAPHVIAAGCTYVGTDILADPKIGLGRGVFYEQGAGPFLRVQADGESLPFADGRSTSTYCVATLHHALDLGADGGRDGPGHPARGARARTERGHAGGVPLGRRTRPGRGAQLRDQRARAHALRVPLGLRPRRPLVRRVEQADGYEEMAGRRIGGDCSCDSRCSAAAPDLVHADLYGYQGASLVARRSAAAPVRIAVCRPQVPFAHGGAEIFTDTLVAELRARGHEAEIVSVPFKWYPGARVLTQAFLWRLLDLDGADGRPIDMVVATKFPPTSSATPRSASGSCTSSARPTSSTAPSWASSARAPEDRAVRRKVQELDRVALGEATRLFATSGNVAGRLERSTGLVAEVLPHPAQALDYRDDGPGNSSSPSTGSTAPSASTC